MSQAGTVDVVNSNPDIPTSVITDDGTAVPIGNELDVLGNTVANGDGSKPVYTTGSGNVVNVNVQVGTTVTGDPMNKNKVGLAQFESTQFNVTTDGYVTLAGGEQAIDSNTGDDSIAVFPDSNGNFNWIGNVVSNNAHAKPVYFKDSVTANAIDLDIKYTTAIEATDGSKVGLAAFDSSQFSVDGSGFVSLVGGGTAIDTITVDAIADTGVNPVEPDDAGNITVRGNVVTQSGNPVRSVTHAVNEYTLEVQYATSAAGADGTKVGLACFDSATFTVGATGFVELNTTGLAETITGDSGGALSPTANNWNIFGLSGSKTSGSGSTLTVKSPPYADSTAATLTINSGTFATAAGSYTLPASPADGDLCEIVCITTGIIVTANTGQEIQIGGDVTSTAGTSTNSSKGDALCLRYRATDTAWYATSVVGVWVLA